MRQRLSLPHSASVFGLVVLAFAVGCGTTTSSSQIHTAQLVALIDITSEQTNEAVVSADIVVSGQRSNSHVVLEGDDHLEASSGAEQHPMLSVGNGTYEARFAHPTGNFAITLVRGVGVPAARSVGTLPATFEITASFGEQPFSRANDALTLRWSPAESAADVTVELEGDCVHSEEFQVQGDPGSFVIEPGRLTAWKNQEQDACGVVLRVVRTCKGHPDPTLDSDSSVVLRQIRSTRFLSAP